MNKYNVSEFFKSSSLPCFNSGDTTNLCANKKCGEMCAPDCGVLTVVRHCQPNGLCNMNSRPKCGKGNI